MRGFLAPMMHYGVTVDIQNGWTTTVNNSEKLLFVTLRFIVGRRHHRINRKLKQPRWRWQQERHKFTYLIMKNNTFARFARAFFIFGHFADVLVLSTTWNDVFCSCVDDVSIWWQKFNFVFLSLKRWFQFNSRIVRTYLASVMTLNNWEMIAETRSYIFRWRSRCRRRCVCLSSLVQMVQWWFVKWNKWLRKDRA